MKICCTFYWGIAKINLIIYNRYGEKMSEKTIKGIPYGVTDYEAIRIDNSYTILSTSGSDAYENLTHGENEKIRKD